MSLQPLDNKELSRYTTGKSAFILAEITIRKSHPLALQRHFKSIRFENKDLWAWKRLLSIVAYDRKIVI